MVINRPRFYVRLVASLVVAAAGVRAAPAAAPDDAPRDAFALSEDLAPEIQGSPAGTIDTFAAGAEFLPFPPADIPFDSWAEPGDRSPFLPLAPETPADTYDALAVAGDEAELYERAAGFAGGWGPGEKRCVILMYHRFRPFPANPYEVSYDDFRAQMEYVARNGYEVISVDQLVTALQTQDPDLLPPRCVVITVDDGYRCVRDYAWPIFRDYGFPFTIYLYTNYIGGGGQSMSWEEIREMAADELVTVGAHSVSHPNLANPKKAVGDYGSWLRHQLTYPKQVLEAETGKPVRTFAWPYGSFNHYTLDAAVRAGYEGILTIAPGANGIDTSPYILRRYGVYWRTTLHGFAMMLEGKTVPDEYDYYATAGKAGGEEEFLIP